MIRRNGHTRSGLAIAVAAVAVLGLLTTPAVLARISRNTIDPVAVVTDTGRHLVVTGPIECTSGERVVIHITVTQRVTGALAEGQTLGVCDGEGRPQQWRLVAATDGRERFQPGPAIAVASARTAFRDQSTDAHQWLVGINLVEDEGSGGAAEARKTIGLDEPTLAHLEAVAEETGVVYRTLTDSCCGDG